MVDLRNRTGTNEQTRSSFETKEMRSDFKGEDGVRSGAQHCCACAASHVHPPRIHKALAFDPDLEALEKEVRESEQIASPRWRGARND
jgi:hypothetical protein